MKRYVLIVIGLAIVAFLQVGCGGGTPTSAPKAAPAAVSTSEPDAPQPTDALTATPVATPTATSIWDIGGQSGSGLQPNPPTRIAKTATPKPTEKVKPTLKPGETEVAPLGEVTNPLTGEKITIPGYNPMPTVNLQPPGAATATPTPKPCTNFLNIGCPAQPKSDQPAPKPTPPSGGEEGGFPWLPVCGGLFLILIVAGIAAFRYFGGSISIQNNTP